MTAAASRWHLAQLNVARLRAPTSDPLIADFMAAIDAVNAAAERSPGYVWRLKSDSGNATDIQLFNDPLTIVNLTIWESVEALHAFTYGRNGLHAPVMARRREWFHHMDEAYFVLWWVTTGHVPTPAEAVERLELLRTAGPSPRAFTFKQSFAPPSQTASTETEAAAPLARTAITR